MVIITEPNYFRFPSIVEMALCSGLFALPVCVFAPDRIPYESLGPAGRFLNYLSYDIPTITARVMFVILAVHVMEASYAFIYAGRMKIKGSYRVAWFFSTLVFGFTSLRKLRQAQEKVDKHRV